MDLHAGTGELMLLAGALALSGVCGGLLAGMFGIGGGAVLVPVFYQAFAMLGVDEAIRMHLAVGTSLGITIPTSIRSFMAHRASGAVDMKLLRSWVPGTLAGVAAGTLLARYLPAEGLKAIFAVIAFTLGLRMIFGVGGARLGRDLPPNPLLAAIGAAIGLFSTLMGVGGGVMTNTAMTLYGRPIHQAVATASGLGVVISLPGAVGFALVGWGAPGLPPFSLGYVSLLGVALVVPVSAFVAPFGARIAHAMEKRRLEFAFGLFLMFVAARFVWSLLG